MKFLLKLLLFVAVVGLLFAADYVYLHQKVTIIFSGIEVQPSLSVLAILLAMLSLVLYLLARIVLAVLFLPRHIRNWRRKRLGQKQDRLLEECLRSLALGDDATAERQLALLAEAASGASSHAYLLAALSAHRLGLKQREITLLNKAAGSGNANSPVKRLAQGYLAMANNKHAEALNEFRSVEGSLPKARRVLEAVAECSERLGDNNAALMNWLAIAKLNSPPEKAALEKAASRLAKVTDPTLIADLYKEEQSRLAKDSQEFAAGLARRLSAANMSAEANALLKKHVKENPSGELLETVADIGAEQLVDTAIESAEGTVNGDGKSAPLLRALGMLYMRKNLWRKAREAFESSLSISPEAATHEALAALLKATGAPADEVIAQYHHALATRRSAPAATTETS